MNLAKVKVGKGKLIALVGPLAFYVGLLVALIAAFVIDPSGWLFVALGVSGVIVGFLNITTRQTGPFLLASIAFIVAAWGMWTLMDTAFTAALKPVPEILTKELLRLATNLTTFIGAAAMVISLRAIYEAAKSR